LNKYILVLEKEQLGMISDGLELLSRIKNGQLHTIKDHVECHGLEFDKALWQLAKTVEPYGIGHSKESDEMYYLYKAINAKIRNGDKCYFGSKTCDITIAEINENKGK
jgi:hypothetical protein